MSTAQYQLPANAYRSSFIKGIWKIVSKRQENERGRDRSHHIFLRHDRHSKHNSSAAKTLRRRQATTNTNGPRNVHGNANPFGHLVTMYFGHAYMAKHCVDSGKSALGVERRNIILLSAYFLGQ